MRGPYRYSFTELIQYMKVRAFGRNDMGSGMSLIEEPHMVKYVLVFTRIHILDERDSLRPEGSCFI